MKTTTFLTCFAAASILFGGLTPAYAQDEATAAGQLRNLSKLVAVIAPASGSEVHGTVEFERVGASVRVTAVIHGLEPGSKHGFHIHEFGDISAEDGSSAGGHYNPDGHPHALPDEETRHAGDLGNLEADDEGTARKTITVSNISLAGSPNPIIGRALVIHAKEDDGSQPTGDAGDRIGMGVIGVSESATTAGSAE